MRHRRLLIGLRTYHWLCLRPVALEALKLLTAIQQQAAES